MKRSSEYHTDSAIAESRSKRRSHTFVSNGESSVELERFERRAKCKAALGLLEAARMLIDRAETEGPKGIGIREAVQFLNRHIDVVQQNLLKAHDK